MSRLRKTVAAICSAGAIATLGALGYAYWTIGEGAARTRSPVGQQQLARLANAGMTNVAIVVLGMGPTPTQPILDRSELAAELWRLGFADAIITSGGQGTDEVEPEARTLANDLVARSVPRNIIWEEAHSVSTIENLTFCRSILQSRGLFAGPVVIVTHDYHARRTEEIALSLGYDPIVITSPGPRLDARNTREFREALSYLKWRLK